MKKLLSVVALAAVALSVTRLEADPVDPVYSMGDPATGTPVTSSAFVFAADVAGGGVLAFVNQSNVLWNNLSITVTEPSNVAITILPGLFFNTYQFSSTPTTAGNSVFSIVLFNTGTGSGGIANGQYFTINLNDLIGNSQNTDPNGAGGWGPGAPFGAVANATGVPGTSSTPEPASVLLLSTGLAGAWLLNRRRKQAL